MAKTPSTMLPLGTTAPGFDLADPHGRQVRREQFSNRPLLVMFICNHCPFVRHLRHSLGAFGQDYAKRGLGIVAINSNDSAAYPADSPAKMVQEATEAGWTFAYLVDSTQAVAKAFRAACTPDFFLFDGAHRLVYRGQYDGSRPGNEIPVTGADLRAAADAVLANRTIDSTQTPSIGCNIKWKTGNAPDYFTG